MKNKKNNKNKGFTMVELLAVIVLMGILAAIAIPSVTKYIGKSRKTSTETMLKSAYEAAENYVMENNVLTSSSKDIYIPELINLQYLEALKDPIGTEGNCGTTNDSFVRIINTSDATTGGLPNYRYEVTIKCPQSGTLKYVYPRDNTLSVMLDAAVKYATKNNYYNNLTTTYKTVTYQNLKDNGYITGIEDDEGRSCHNSNSKVLIRLVDNNPEYNVTLVCGTGSNTRTYTATYAFK